MRIVRGDSEITEEICGKLRNLKTSWEGKKLELPQTTEGCGTVVTQLQELGEKYQELYDTMTVLIDNSVEFLCVAYNAIRETEQNLVDSFQVEK